MKKRAIVLFSMALTACSANNLNQGAERVRITNTEPTGNCTFLGEVTGSQGNFFTGGWTSNSNLETGARNDLKNQAYSMGVTLSLFLRSEQGRPGAPTSAQVPANKLTSR